MGVVALQKAYSGLRFFVPISQKVNYPLILQNYHTMQENTNEELQLRIRDLEKEVARLHAQIKKQRYGLVWLDVPEGFESETENKIPILEEVKDKAIKNDDGKPTHILIEGDNYHALTCLNYTHKGKIDVIYIDPPYNTGSDGFTYKDKRILKEFPDGTPVPKDHPMRHSYWLSFMSKRLELAKNLLSDKGVIFISIDDNEQANLKLLCDKVFGEENFVGCISRATGTTTGQDTGSIGKACDYIIVYSKKVNYRIGGIPLSEKDLERYSMKDEKGNFSILQLRRTGGEDRREDRPTMYFPIIAPDGTEVFPIGPTGYESRWRVGPKKVQEMISENLLYFKKDKKDWKVYYKFYSEGKDKRPSNMWTDIDGNKKGSLELKSIISNIQFETPKPLQLVKRICELTTSPTSTVLDFFAGSGTTMHAVMKLNEEDGGKRQCILVQQKENEQNICESVTYERNKRVIQGYTNSKNEKVEGLGNSLKYYKTGFVGKNNSNNATDSDKVELSLKAGYLLALAENTLEELSRNDFYQIFGDGKGRITAVYFKGSMMRFGQFVGEIENHLSQKKTNKANVYIFCWGDVSIYENEFDDMSRISLKAIPKPILDIYKSINC